MIALAALATGGLSVAHGLAQAVVRDDPELAHRLAPWDGRNTAALAGTLIGPDAAEGQGARAAALARQALRREPTAVGAVTVLGVEAQLAGDVERARALFTQAAGLTRREFPAQLFLIEDAVGRGDTAGALRHYDMALRTQPGSWEMLFPILASASASPQVRAELVRTLAGKPLWADAFVRHAVAKPGDAQTVGSLLLALERAGVVVPERSQAGAIDLLLAEDRAEDAWTYYTALRPGVNRSTSRDPRFAAALQAPSVFDWRASSSNGINASIQREGAQGLFAFAAPASVGGPVLQQAQVLPPGVYQLSGISRDITAEARALPYWVLACRAGRRELGRVVVPASGDGPVRFAGSLTVPADCPVQVLTLFVRASNAVGGVAGQIERALLEPAR